MELTCQLIKLSMQKKNYKKKGQFFTPDEFRFENYEKYFDYITVIGLIEFIDKEELINLIKELKKMLNEKGEIYFTTPNFTIGMKIMILVQRVFSRVSYSSVFKTEYTKSKLEDLLSKNYVKNYEITKIQNLGFLFSYFSLNLGVKISNLISKFTFNRTGFLLLLRISND